MTDQRWTRGALLIALAAAAGLALFVSPIGKKLYDPGEIIAAAGVYSNRWWMVLVYAAVYAIFDVLFIPTQGLSIAAVLLWGWVKGGTIELFSATAGAIVPYLIARSTLRDWISARVQKHAAVRAALERESFTFLLLLRVVPIIPYTALNYVAGLSSISLARYVIATFLGVIPSTYIFAYFVDSMAQGVLAPRQVFIRILGAGALLAALIIATRLAAPRLRRRMSTGHTSPLPGAADRD